MSRKTDYFVKFEVSTSGELNELCEVATRYVPVLISAIEGRKARSFWATPADHSAAYNHLCAQQGALLMGAKDDIIQEVRDVRGPLNGTDLSTVEAFPVGTFPGFNLGHISNQMNADGQNLAQLSVTANTTLGEIKTLLEASGGSNASMLEQLIQIAAYLAV